MKKLIIVAIASLVALPSFAQFGIMGGLTSSATNISAAAQELTTKTINQYHVGITYKFELGKVFALQPALLYNVKGAKIGELTGLSDINFKTGFIELPIQLQAGVSLGKVLRIYAIGEPFIGYAITNSVTMDSLKDTSWDNIKNRLELGAAAGAGIELFKHVQVSVRYFWNFKEVYGQEIDISSATAELSNSKCKGITLSAAVLF